MFGVEKVEMLVPVDGVKTARPDHRGDTTGDGEAPAETGQCANLAGSGVPNVAQEAVGQPVEVIPGIARWRVEQRRVDAEEAEGVRDLIEDRQRVHLKAFAEAVVVGGSDQLDPTEHRG